MDNYTDLYIQIINEVSLTKQEQLDDAALVGVARCRQVSVGRKGISGHTGSQCKLTTVLCFIEH